MIIFEQGIWRVSKTGRACTVVRAGKGVAILSSKFIDDAEISFVTTRDYLEIRLSGQAIMRIP